MAARKQSAAQAKAAKQKKLAIGGAVLLVGVLVIQGPKMLKMISGGSSAAPAAAVAPVPVAPVPGAVPATPAPATLQPGGTKLVSFERFSSKDPFSAQVSTSAPSASVTSGTAATATATGTAGAAVTLVPKTTSSTASTVKPTVKKTSMEILQVSGNGSARITVNGTTESVNRSKDFPKSDPTFTLADVNAQGQSVTVSIAGGSLKTGGKTFTLYKDVPKTLLNTADGKRYTLILVSVQAPN